MNQNITGRVDFGIPLLFIFFIPVLDIGIYLGYYNPVISQFNYLLIRVNLMELITALSKTEQVIKYIKAQIDGPKLKHGSKLPSTRKLAKYFSNSEQVIKSAYNILEKEGYVYKRARSGVFVKKELSHIKQVYVLGIVTPKDDHYFKEILKITYPPLLKEGFSFITRTYSPEFSLKQVLKIETSRINSMKEVSCVLISASQMGNKDILEFLQLDKPVIFLGDFSQGNFNDIAYNQITGDNAYLAEQQIYYLHKKRHKNITLFTGSLEHFFNRQFYENMRKNADKNGMKLSIVEFPRGVSSQSEEKNKNNVKSTLKLALKTKKIYKTAVISGIDHTLVRDSIKQVDQKLFKELFFWPPYLVDFSKFHHAIIMRMEELMCGEKGTRKMRIKLPLIFNQDTGS